MGKRVLVADDSATIQKAFAMVFGGQDVALVAARSLEEALTSARQSRPDLVIADAALGARTGYELCAALKADPSLRGLPVYILSSTHTPYDEGRGREAGADGNLLKPFESQGIIDKVNEILARTAAAPAPVAAPTTSPPVASAFRPAPSGPVPTARRDRDDDDDYGEMIIERPTTVGPAAPAAAAARAPAAPAVTPLPPAAMPAVTQPAPTFPGLRPSLIPGARPGPGFAPRPVPSAAQAAAAPNPFAPRPAPAAPAQPAVTPVVPSPAATPSGPALAAPAPTAQANVGRTMMGMPAVMIPGVPNRAPAGGAPTPGMPASPAKPAAAPGVTPFASVVPTAAKSAAASASASSGALSDVTPPPVAVPPRAAPVAASSAATAAVSARVEQKLGAFAARGPEYEALARLSREVIEQIVWEVVPELAEIIIREHVERQLKDVGKK
jgi:CheY-like chemotaxis protein